MKQITKEIIDKARAALEKDDCKAFFEAFGFKVYGDVKIGNVEECNGIELEAYSDGGEDMIVTLEVDEDWKEDFRKYVENFDANECVMMWWQQGEDYAHKKGVPFNTVAEHYEDYKSWIEWMEDIVRVMDGKEPKEAEPEEPSKDAISAIVTWNYWCSNYDDPNVWAHEIWVGWEADHFIEKFNDAKSLDQFFRQLDHNNQEKLAKYVLEHYKP